MSFKLVSFFYIYQVITVECGQVEPDCDGVLLLSSSVQCFQSVSAKFFIKHREQRARNLILVIGSIALVCQR